MRLVGLLIDAAYKQRNYILYYITANDDDWSVIIIGCAVLS